MGFNRVPVIAPSARGLGRVVLAMLAPGPRAQGAQNEKSTNFVTCLTKLDMTIFVDFYL